jgi:hypothetical protein
MDTAAISMQADAISRCAVCLMWVAAQPDTAHWAQKLGNLPKCQSSAPFPGVVLAGESSKRCQMPALNLLSACIYS